VKLDYEILGARLRAPLVSAHSRMESRPLVAVTLTADDGLVGHGEAAPLESYDGVGVDRVVAELERARRALDTGGPAPDDLLPQALAAIDLAGFDLRGRREGAPVWRLLGAERADPIAVNATIGAESPECAAALASAASAAGFACVKLKVGVEHDLARVRAVRDACPELAIRLDANGAWTVSEAVAVLAELEPLGVECCEEPVHGVDQLEAVAAASGVAVAADETTSDPALFGRRACAAVCLKIAASGGIAGVIADAERARAAGYQVYLASTLDGPLGIAAALHAATVVRPDRPCGLATLAQFESVDPLPPVAGTMTAPSGPGLIGL
jgi:L-alanine-DL-glutamate epimerase-like enolase superfamily enzyme